MANYKYENGNYYRQSSSGNWFKVILNNKGQFTWTQPDGKKVYDPNSDKAHVPGEKLMPIGSGFGDIKEWISPRKYLSDEKYQKKSISDPSENILNDLIFSAATGIPKIAYSAGKALVNGTIDIGKRIAKTISEQGLKKAVKKGATKTTEFTLKQLPRVTTGVAAEKLVDQGSLALTDKTWAQNVSDGLSQHWGFYVPEEVTYFTNPGIYAGYGLMDRAIRRASFNHITPLAYHDGVAPLSKFQEGVLIVKDVPKQFFNFKPINKPKWRKRFEDANIDLEFPISTSDFLNNREDALRIAFKLPQKYNTYIKNPNGTYSYNLDVLSKQGNPHLYVNGFQVSPSGIVTPRYAYTGFYKDGLYGDALGFNGGFINQTEKDGMLHLVDVWDIQPFKDVYRLPSFKGAKLIHKHMPEIEVLNVLGGKPFELNMTIPKN